MLLASASFAQTAAVGTTDQLEKAKDYKEKVAIPGHSDGSGEGWTSGFDLGASFTSGNSETSFITASLTLDKEVDQDEYFLNATYAYGENDGDLSTEELLLIASWKRLFTDRTYWGFRLDGRHDELANIKYRVGLTALVGHYLIKNEKTNLSIEGGAGYTLEDQDGSDSYANVYLGQQFNHWISDSTRIYQNAAFIAPFEDLEDYQLIAEAGLETFLSSQLSLKLYVQNKYENLPAAGLEKNDLKFVTGISYKF